ncbi:MAG: ABC transporter ATP-binding protein [Pseudoalteromonas distincta]
MLSEWQKYRKALQLTKSYYPKVLSYFIAVGLILLVLALGNAFVPVLLREATNALADDGAPLAIVLGTAAAYVFCWTGAQIVEWIKNIASAAILVRCDAAFYRGFYEHLLKQPFEDFKKLDQGTLTADVQRSRGGFSALTSTVFWILIPTALELLFVFSVLANLINTMFAFMFISGICGLVGISVILSRKAKGIHQNIVESNNVVMSHFVERMRFAEEIKLNNAYDRERQVFGEKVQYFIDKVTVGNFRIGVLMLLQVLLVGMLLMASTLYVVQEVAAGRYSVGDFVMINGYVIQLTFRLALLASVLIELRNHFVLLDRAFHYLDMPSEPNGCHAPEANREVIFELSDVSYAVEDRMVLRDITLHLMQGYTYAITGPSGAGKTTLFRLLCGLIRPNKGVVSAFGVDFNQMDRKAFFDRVAVVTQNPILIVGSVADNVQYNSDGTLSPKLMKEILVELGLDAHSSSSALAEKGVGYDAASVSGGEKQRIAIARALARRKETVLLDEPTSALDNATEGMAMDMLKNRTRTLIMVTHRAPLIAKADFMIHLPGDGSVSISPVDTCYM